MASSSMLARYLPQHHKAQRNIAHVALKYIVYMQARAIDTMDGIHLIDALKNLGITMRNEADLYHDCW